ncbi:hypothetical protein Pcinc_031140 [Petrolisthes cinctipes]|uniref:Uncharacterized protein n=1 Tax=Petrolisthes cinctipes TaxID=88211 RepID=A0AAE1EWY4_PETCI|nr:hypothetical protein Pcinc_031140 [Petrolisthes cinctipes]
MFPAGLRGLEKTRRIMADYIHHLTDYQVLSSCLPSLNSNKKFPFLTDKHPTTTNDTNHNYQRQVYPPHPPSLLTPLTNPLHYHTSIPHQQAFPVLPLPNTFSPQTSKSSQS